MAAKRTAEKTPSARQPKTDDVDEFMKKVDHPLKAALEMVRSIIRGASPAIAEGIKWNAPSFYVREYFATASINTRAKTGECVQVIFHRGAKVKDNSTLGPAIRDPGELLEWLAK